HEPAVVVVESPAAAQVETILNQVLAPGIPEPFGPSVVLVMESSQRHRARHADMAQVSVDVSALPDHQIQGLISNQSRSKVSIRQLNVAAGGLPSLIDSTLRSTSSIGEAEFNRIVAKAREPSALTQAVVQRLLENASFSQLAALE